MKRRIIEIDENKCNGCCGGLELAAKKALQQSGKFIPWQVVTVTVDGRLVEE